MNFKSAREQRNKAALEIFAHKPASQVKGCPKSAFLGLCEEGKVKGIPTGDYTESLKNKAYALKALALLQENSELADDHKALWLNIQDGKRTSHNGQMNVVIALFRNDLTQ